jgi:hypothetical protein
MIQDLGVCKGPGKALCEIRIGRDKIRLAKVGRFLYALLNNRAILAAESKKDFISKSLPVLALAIKDMAKKAQMDTIRWNPIKQTTDMVDEAINCIKDNITPVQVFMLEQKPDEIEDNHEIEASERLSLVQRLENYRKDMDDFGTNLAGIRQTSGVLLKTSLTPKMWGSKEVMKVINEMHSEKEDIDSGFELVEACMEHSNGHIDLIRASLNKKTASNNLMPFVGKVIESFSTTKSFMSKLAQSLQSLHTIDRVFKAHTGYPATWFFDPTTYMDFNFEYGNLISNLIKTASIESEIVEPLLLWKIKTGAC